MYFVGVERNTNYTYLIAVKFYKSKTFTRLFAERLLQTTPFVETVFVLTNYPQKVCEFNSDELLNYCIEHYYLIVHN